MGLQKGNLQVSKDDFGSWMTAQTSESLENPIWKMSLHNPQGHGKHHSVTSKGIAIAFEARQLDLNENSHNASSKKVGSGVVLE